MKHEDRKELLEDLYPGGGTGPSVERVLENLRRDRVARSRRNFVAVAAVVLLGLGMTVPALWKSPVKTPLPAQVAVAKVPETVERISDDELLAAMGRPAALVTLPDGRQSVIYLAPVAQRQ